MLDILLAIREWFEKHGLNSGNIEVVIQVHDDKDEHFAYQHLVRDTDPSAFDQDAPFVLNGIPITFRSRASHVTVSRNDVGAIQDLLYSYRNFNSGMGLLLHRRHVRALEALGVKGPFTEVSRIPEEGWKS